MGWGNVGIRQGKATQGNARQDKARQGKARQGKARQGKARQGKARQGKARQGKARQGNAMQGKARQAFFPSQAKSSQKNTTEPKGAVRRSGHRPVRPPVKSPPVAFELAAEVLASPLLKQSRLVQGCHRRPQQEQKTSHVFGESAIFCDPGSANWRRIVPAERTDEEGVRHRTRAVTRTRTRTKTKTKTRAGKRRSLRGRRLRWKRVGGRRKLATAVYITCEPRAVAEEHQTAKRFDQSQAFLPISATSCFPPKKNKNSSIASVAEIQHIYCIALVRVYARLPIQWVARFKSIRELLAAKLACPATLKAIYRPLQISAHVSAGHGEFLNRSTHCNRPYVFIRMVIPRSRWVK